jgi:hypothetical protein
MYTKRKKLRKSFFMKQPIVGDAEYQANIKALKDHKVLVDLIVEGHENIDFAEMKRSLKNLAYTVEEYFKVIGMP